MCYHKGIKILNGSTEGTTITVPGAWGNSSQLQGWELGLQGRLVPRVPGEGPLGRGGLEEGEGLEVWGAVFLGGTP